MPDVNPFELRSTLYDAWFASHPYAYASEIEAVRELLPTTGEFVEVGVGTGRFAGPLGIRVGVEPSPAMRAIAIERGIEVVDGTAEALPFADHAFDGVLMVTTICFVEDIDLAFQEAHRVIRPEGCIVVGFIDRASSLGKRYEARKKESLFYRHAHFYSVDEVARHLFKAGFTPLQFVQTIFRDAETMDHPDPVLNGYGAGAFVVVKGSRV